MKELAFLVIQVEVFLEILKQKEVFLEILNQNQNQMKGAAYLVEGYLIFPKLINQKMMIKMK